MQSLNVTPQCHGEARRNPSKFQCVPDQSAVQLQARLDSMSVPFARSQPPQMHMVKPSVAPALPPAYQASASGPNSAPLPRHHGHHHHHHLHRVKPAVVAPSPTGDQSCDQVCIEPLTATPFGSPCGCVFPMKVRLLLDVAPYAIFPVMNELEIEVAEGTYLEQSQVKIMGASADSDNQGKTVVDINLVPLGDKFDNTTAILTYERFWHKKVPLNKNLFGDYEVISISYPGIPSSPPYPDYMGSGPSGSAGDLPITANFLSKSQKMNLRTIAIIALSAFVVLLVIIGAVFIFIRWRKFGRPSSAVGPTFASSINKRSGIGSFLSSSIASSTSMSLMSTMATCMLSVKTFPYTELEKATEKFSSKRILGEGGFGRVYCGIMEDGSEVAVKLLTRDNQNGDREFIAEVEMLSRLHHRNLVKLIGICIEGRTRCLVYELVPNGSVESHLHGFDKRSGPLDWDARLKIALGAARGLAYLHEDSNPRVIHRDFKASNVLLEDDFTPKVSDFGLAREATEGSHHISTRVMGTFGYVAPEYAMTGHLLVKSDVYSYGVVLLELLSGRKPVDMSQPPGEENLVTWARPLLTSREGLEQLVDPSLAGTYDFDDMAKVAAIASMCVHPEVTNRPFMGEVVQALKLIYNDMDETCGDNCSQKESSTLDSDIKGDLAPSDSSWWNAAGISPRITYGQASSFITMEYSSGPLEETENRPFSASSLVGDRLSLAIRHGNRSGPLRTVRSKPAFYRLRGSMSEHGGLLSRQKWNDGYWV
ncbi:receptor-like serine/threonine-protein kinase ALE2 isoform X2 [Hevea brasiliensis]|uniref:receptor-like serine/threonine-protein kinase ALE2 isoform X2 n=1 Tax=Hevea brasiliensis TaxID=3981 RepID=UPI0025D71EBE|nr:receptor-like serine/threonine-protein kinase ALE2 isoform X2 [Hevea brasiliensis]